MSEKRVLTVGKIFSGPHARHVRQEALSADGKSVLQVTRYESKDAPPAFRTALFSAANALWTTSRRNSPVL